MSEFMTDAEAASVLRRSTREQEAKSELQRPLVPAWSRWISAATIGGVTYATSSIDASIVVKAKLVASTYLAVEANLELWALRRRVEALSELSRHRT